MLAGEVKNSGLIWSVIYPDRMKPEALQKSGCLQFSDPPSALINDQSVSNFELPDGWHNRLILELAQRESLPLATLDSDLAAAARSEKVKLIGQH